MAELSTQRLFYSLDATPETELNGLLRSSDAELALENGTAFRIEDLIEQPLVLVVGPPHSGKSVSVSAVRRLAQTREVLFTEGRAIDGDVAPAGLERWKHGRAPGVWCIDALDEAPQSSRAAFAVADAWQRLKDEHQDRLNLLVTCRENEVPEKGLERIRATVGREWMRVRIAPPTFEVAAEICGGTEGLRRALTLIETAGLWELAQHPAALRFLARHPFDAEEVTRAKVWRGAIEEVLDAGFELRSRPHSTLSERFRAAARLAFMLEFGPSEWARCGGGDSRAPLLSEAFGPREVREILAAEEVVLSALFVRSGERVRIASRHLREWLVAFQVLELCGPDRWAQVRQVIRDRSRPTLAESILEVVGVHNVNRELVDWLAATARVEFFAHAVAAADLAPIGLASPQVVRRIVVATPRQQLERELLDGSNKWNEHKRGGKELMLWIAAQASSRVFIDIAQSTLTDAHEDHHVRTAALGYLKHIGAKIDWREKAETISQQEGSSRLLANVLLDGLRTGALEKSVVRAMAPRPARGIGDSRSLLEIELATRLTVSEAIDEIQCAPPESEHEHDVLFDAAVELLGKVTLSSSQSEKLVDAVLSADEVDERWEKVLAAQMEVRREAYRKAHVSGEVPTRLRFALRSEDSEFLDELLRNSAVSEALVIDCLRMGLTESARAFAPDLVSKIERANAETEARIATIRGQHRQEPKRIPLERALRDQLEKSDSPNNTLHVCGWLAFGPRGVRPLDVEGSFEELPEALRNEVLERVRAALGEAEPSAIPPGNGIPNGVLFEGACLEAAIAKFGPAILGETGAQRWFPTLLRGLEAESVQALARQFPSVGVTAFSKWIEREIREGDRGAFTAHRAPTELWSFGLASEILKILADDTLPGAGAAPHLELVATHSPSEALAVARNWAATRSEDRSCLIASCRVQLRIAPVNGLELLAQLASKPELVAEVLSPFGSYTNVAPIDHLSESELLRLAQLIFTVFPEATDINQEPGVVHTVSNHDRVINLRHRLVNTLMALEDRVIRDGLRQIAESNPELKRRIEQTDAEEKLESAFGGDEPPGRPPVSPPEGEPPTPHFTWEQLLKLLLQAAYRLPQTPLELQSVVCEVLERINSQIADDLEIFYPEQLLKAGQRTYEPVLQAYLRRRLSDLVPGTIIDREAWRLTGATDLEARVFDSNGHQRAAVPIEIKWSDNPETAEAPNRQLGMKYMSANSHGVFVVAWSSVEDEALRTRVHQSVESFCKANSPKNIRTVWLSACHPDLAKYQAQTPAPGAGRAKKTRAKEKRR
ncbi:MAG: hypothetical protein ACOZQL_02960 [Myxococcota bacterium]